jgi:nicotinamidase-related amidase
MADTTVQIPVPEPKELVLDPRHAAVLIVDLENEFMHPNGLSYLGARAERILGNVAELLDKARAVDVPVIYSRSVREADDAEFTVFKRKRHLLRGGWGAEFSDEVAPRPGDPIVEKRSHDCFNGTEMEATLARLGVRPCTHTVIVTGVGINVCVTCAADGLSVRDYWVAMPMDCVAGGNELVELLTFQHFMHPAWAYNVALTRSDRIEFRPGVGAPIRAELAVGSVR